MKRGIWGIPWLLIGCMPLYPNVGREAVVCIYPRFQEQTQALVSPNTLESIATLDIIPYVETSSEVFSPVSNLSGTPTAFGAPDMLKLSMTAPVDPSRPFVLKRLKPNKKYRILGRAYNAGNVQISLDASSSTDVLVGSDDAPGMATLPVSLTNTPFGATAAVAINATGRYEYLKGTLYLASGNTPLALIQTTKRNPDLIFNNLQANTNYRLVVEAYKLNAMLASSSLTLGITNESTPATASLGVNIPYVVTTLAGGTTTGFVDGLGTNARVNAPTGVELDAQGNLYFIDHSNSAVRKVSPAGLVTTIAGTESIGFADGSGTSAMFKAPHSLGLSSDGIIYVADTGNNRIRKVTPSGVVTTFVGNGTAGYADGAGTNALITGPIDIFVDPQGNLFVTENGNRVRKVTPEGVVSTFAGNGTAGYADGEKLSAMLSGLRGITMDGAGNFYVTSGPYIRKIGIDGMVSTVAGKATEGYADGTGTNAMFSWPEMLAIDAEGNLYVTEHNGHRIRKITAQGVVTTIAGNGTVGYADGTGTAAKLNVPWGITIDPQGILYLGEFSSNPLRKIY